MRPYNGKTTNFKHVYSVKEILIVIFLSCYFTSTRDKLGKILMLANLKNVKISPLKVNYINNYMFARLKLPKFSLGS